jgi:thymidylate synthase
MSNSQCDKSTYTPLVTPPSTKKRKSDDGSRNQDDEDLRNVHFVNAKRKIDLLGTSYKDNPVGLLRDHSDNDSSSSRSASPTGPHLSQMATQPVDYSQDLFAGLDGTALNVEPLLGVLEDPYDPSNKIELRTTVVTMGRLSTCDVTIPNLRVGRNHCSLTFATDSDGDTICFLSPLSGCCWIRESDEQWSTPTTEKILIPHRGRFRLLQPGRNGNAKGVEYTLSLTAKAPSEPANPGSHSFDVAYLKLLRQIQMEGVLKLNKKGNNYTLPKLFALNIDLSDKRGRNLLPLSSLRSLYGGRGALIEALWYLRGEDNVSFLQDNKCHFWDKQATAEGWVGWNYGLLTNFPQEEGRGAMNQLEERVIRQLCRPGSSSRNMVCSLDKPGEETVQGACTSSIQFSVSSEDDGCESLQLTVFQRSSDVLMGLPHDVVVWSIILHLVRREVWIRSKRELNAGKLSFVIGQNAAHVYQLNEDAMQMILKREPKQNCQPFLVVDDADQRGIFDLAKDFKPESFRICSYTKDVFHPAITLLQAVEKH